MATSYEIDVDSQDKIPYQDVTYVPSVGGDVRLVVHELCDTTRWGTLWRTVFSTKDNAGNTRYYAYVLEHPSGDAEVDTEPVTAYEVDRIARVVYSYERKTS